MKCAKMYDQLLIDHYKNPRNCKIIEGVAPLEGTNPLCGDEVQLYIKGNDVGFQSKGCSLCIASASILCEQLSKDINNTTMPEVLINTIEKYKSRAKCIKLAWEIELI